MSAESGWAVAVGAAISILSWVVGLGKIVWPSHPQWAIFLIGVVVAVASAVILEPSILRGTKLAH